MSVKKKPVTRSIKQATISIIFCACHCANVACRIQSIRVIPEDHNPLSERDIRFNRKKANALENQYSQSILHKNNDINGHPTGPHIAIGRAPDS